MNALMHQDNDLIEVSRAKTQKEKLNKLHRIFQAHCPGIDRVSVALHDSGIGTFKTFISSPADQSPLENYETKLDAGSSLSEVVRTRYSRVVNNLDVFAQSPKEHSCAILGHGFAASYTHPICDRQKLYGLVFFNSVHKGYFREKVLDQVEIFAHLVSETVMNDLNALHSLAAALRTAIGMVHMRDPETGSHLERMARYSRLIASELARTDLHPLDDEQIEQIFHFAPLHDVGKIGIPDRILLKPGSLASAERKVMNTHTLMGRQIVDQLIAHFDFERIPYIEYLRNIVESHHEAMDGSGYPNGLHGEKIPVEARVVAVSDVFDALTSRRPYKKSWSNQHALSMMQLMAIDKLDSHCVEVLMRCNNQLVQIQNQFGD